MRIDNHVFSSPHHMLGLSRGIVKRLQTSRRNALTAGRSCQSLNRLGFETDLDLLAFDAHSVLGQVSNRPADRLPCLQIKDAVVNGAVDALVLDETEVQLKVVVRTAIAEGMPSPLVQHDTDLF